MKTTATRRRAPPLFHPLPPSLLREPSLTDFDGLQAAPLEGDIAAGSSVAFLDEDTSEPPPDDERGLVHELLRPPRSPRATRHLDRAALGPSQPPRSPKVTRHLESARLPDTSAREWHLGGSVKERGHPWQSGPSPDDPAGWIGCSPAAGALFKDARQLASGCASSLAGTDFERSDQDKVRSSRLTFHPQPEGDHRRRNVDVIEHACEVVIIHHEA